MRECPTCQYCFPDNITSCPHDGTATLPSLRGETILDGRYQLEKRLGQGAMGIVFKARHVFLKSTHAIKVILPDLVGHDPMLATRFRQEAMASASVRHQNIVAVTDFGVIDETMPFLVMEYVHGKSLHDSFMAEGALPLARALEIIEPICAGVAAAHRRGIIHRDLKPLNIMIAYGEPIHEAVKLLDFGLAKIKSGELLGSFVAAQTTGMIGSPYYMAPEQWGDEEPDARCDIYSLGIILYEMLAGDVPFKASSIPAVMRKHLTERPPAFTSVGVDIPAEIEAVVRRALEKDPDQRPQSVDDFMTALRDAVAVALPSLTVRSSFQLEFDESSERPRPVPPESATNMPLITDQKSAIVPDGSSTALGLKSLVFSVHGATIAPASKAPDVFICYAMEDKEVAEAICQTLEAKNIECWIAHRNALPGMNYAKAIINALKASRVMVLLFSSQSNDSPQVMREVERAASTGMTIIPVRIEDVPLSDDMQFYVSSPHWYDALTPPLEKHLQSLALIVHWHLQMSATSQ